MSETDDGIPIRVESLRPEVTRLFESLQIPLETNYSSLTNFRNAFEKVHETLVESGLTKEVSSLISSARDGTVIASVHAELSRPSYSLGANLNQRGQPSFEGNLSVFPKLPFIRPFQVQLSANSTYPSGGSLSGAFIFPRLHNSLFRCGVRVFSDDSELAECVTAHTQGVEASAKFLRNHEVTLRLSQRENSPKADSFPSFYEVYGLNRLRSDRFSLLYKFCIDKTRYLRDRPSVASSGWSFAGLLDIPVIRTDADNLRFSTKATKFVTLPQLSPSTGEKLKYPTVLGLTVRSGVNILPYSVGSKSSTVPVNDKFFLGGAAEDLVQFPGFKAKGACVSGALAFTSATAELSFDLFREAGVRGSLFLHSGLSCADYSEGFPLQTRIAFGCSLLLPMGPRRTIRVVAAKPLLANPGDKEQLFQMGITLGSEI